MQQEIKNFLDKNSDRILTRITAEEMAEIKNIISGLASEILASQSQETKSALINTRFGILQNTILHLAAKFGDDLSLKNLLLEAGQDVNVRNDDYFTPLHFAASNGHLAVVNILINAGADKIAQASEKKRKWIPIHYAAQFGHVDVVKALIGAGVSKEIKTGFGLTPLVVGAEFGHLNVVQFMLSIGADKNVQTIEDNHKMTALHYAVIGNFADVVEALLSAKINKEKETTFGLTALEFAAKNNLDQMVVLLLSYGANKWESALKIAQESKSEDAVRQIKQFQKVRTSLFTDSGLENVSSSLLAAVKQFNADNLSEAKIILEGGVAFNAYGILSLTQQFGFFSKVTKTFIDFVDESGSGELTSALKKLNLLAGISV